jgi:hypothetical protein
MKWQPMTADQLRAALARPGKLVLFAARKGTVERMPQTPIDMRRPSERAPLTRGIVDRVSRDGTLVRVESGGHGGWIAVADGLYFEDTL